MLSCRKCTKPVALPHNKFFCEDHIPGKAKLSSSPLSTSSKTSPAASSTPSLHSPTTAYASNNSKIDYKGWFVPYPSRPQAVVRLICFPYAGGSATVFKSWSEAVDSRVELVGVQYPGRANRINTPPYRKIVDLVKELAPLLSAYTADKPYALFGHSLGGTIAFEVIRELKRIKAKLPIKLFIGDRGFPRTPEEAAELSDSDSDDEDPPSWQRSDEQFIEKLRKLEGTPPEILANTELMKMCLPSLRADFEMCDEQFIIDETVPLELPITVFGGMNSKHHSKSRLQGWSKRTSSSDFIVRMVPGNHFEMVTKDPSLLLQTIHTDVFKLLGSR